MLRSIQGLILNYSFEFTFISVDTNLGALWRNTDFSWFDDAISVAKSTAGEGSQFTNVIGLNEKADFEERQGR